MMRWPSKAAPLSTRTPANRNSPARTRAKVKGGMRRAAVANAATRGLVLRAASEMSWTNVFRKRRWVTVSASSPNPGAGHKSAALDRDSVYVAVISEAERPSALQKLVAKLRLRRCTSVGEGARVFGRIDVVDRGVRRIGRRVTLDASTSPIELKAEAEGEIVLGDDVHVESGVSIWAYSRITIGSRVRVGAFCQIVDNHFHMPGEDRFMFPKSKPVTIEDDVVIGAHVVLLPGAHIGQGSVVHPRTVVTRRVPPFSDIRGVPATVTPRVKPEEQPC